MFEAAEVVHLSLVFEHRVCGATMPLKFATQSMVVVCPMSTKPQAMEKWHG
jgi:hypothetical protein